MSNLVTRGTKGSALTHNEGDTNLKKGAQTKAASYTVVEGDNRDSIDVTATATITLPDAATIAAAADTGDFEVTLNNTAANTLTITCVTGTDTIAGSTSDFVLTAIDSVTLKVNQAGNGYNIIASGLTGTNPTINGKPGRGIVFLDDVETLATITTIPTNGAWTSSSGFASTTLSDASAVAAIIRIFYRTQLASSTDAFLTARLRKAGTTNNTSAEYIASQRQNSSASALLQCMITGEGTVALDANSDFEYAISYSTSSTHAQNMTIALVGYYV